MQFRLLGPLAVDGLAGDGAVPDGARLRSLLAALLLRANAPVSREALAEAVWDGAPPAGAQVSLRGHVLRLRRALGAEAGSRIAAREPGYLIRLERGEIDVLEFEALCGETGRALRAADWGEAADRGAHAAALWRGEPLLDVPSQVLRNEFTPRLEQLLVQVREDYIEADLRLGRHAQSVEQLRELTAAYPLRERFHAQLMLALARSGRRSEALDAYQHARRVLVGQLGIEPGSELRDLHESVLNGDLEPVPAPAAGAMPHPMAPEPAAPRQLPTAARHFIGRRTELDELTSLLDETDASGGTVVISAIDGMAGIGKTALAVHAAHRLAEKFPDGQLFIDLHGYTQGHPPRTADDALDFLLRALGVPPGQIPQDVEQAAAFYRQRLVGTRTLIVLDNAASEAQVRPLLPGTGSCLALVTSRRRLKALDDAHSLSLDLLAPPDAAALLRAVAGAERIPADDPLVAEVAGLCGYLPLALRIAASLLRHRPVWSLEHLVGQVRDQTRGVSALSDGERELAAVFDLSYTSLGEPHQTLFRRLGLIPGPDLDAYAASALAQVDPARAAGLLEDLVDHNLLTAYAPDRYRVHDLLRAHARALADTDLAPEREAAVDRLLRYYAHTAQNASIRIARYPRPDPHTPAPAHAPVLSDSEAARAWLRSERDNLEAAHTHAQTTARYDHALPLAAGLAEILRTDGPLTRALDLHQAAADTAERHGHPADHADALMDLGRVQYLSGDLPGARSAHEQALETYRAIDDRRGEANALTDLGRVWQLIGDLPGAGDAHGQALEIYRAIGDRHCEANALTNLGRVQQLIGNLAQARRAHEQALEIHRALGNRHGEANALTDLARLQKLVGDLPGAAGAHKQALEIHRAQGNRAGEANVLTELGNVKLESADLAGAGEALSPALEIYRTIGHRVGEATALGVLGCVLRLTGDLAGAHDALSRALEIHRTNGNRSDEAWALNHYAAILADSGRRTHALTVYQQALAMNRELNKPDDEAISLEGLAEHYLTAGDLVQGAAHLHRALEIYQRLGMDPDTKRVQQRLSASESVDDQCARETFGRA